MPSKQDLNRANNPSPGSLDHGLSLPLNIFECLQSMFLSPLPLLLCESNAVMPDKFVYLVLKHQARARNGEELLFKYVSDVVLGISHAPSIIIFANA